MVRYSNGLERGNTSNKSLKENLFWVENEKTEQMGFEEYNVFWRREGLVNDLLGMIFD